MAPIAWHPSLHGRGSPDLKVFRAEKDQRLDSFDHLTFYAGEEITVVAQHLPGVGSLGRCQGIIGWVRRLERSVLARTPAHQTQAPVLSALANQVDDAHLGQLIKPPPVASGGTRRGNRN